MICQASWCAVHWQPEVVVDGALVCGECGHVYETAADLLDAHNRDPLNPRVWHADLVLACPECGHDF